MIGRNVERFVADAVESALAQTYSDLEVLFIDDGSTDATGEIVQSFTDERVRYERNETSLGIAASRNRTLALSRGEFVAVLDADDLTEVTRVELQLRAFTETPTLGLIGGAIRLIDADGNELAVRHSGATTPSTALRHLRWKCPFVHSTVMYRTELARAAGGYDESATIGSDYGLWLRIGATSDVVNLDAVLASYRLHSGQITNTKKSFDRASLASLRSGRLTLATSRSESILAARGRDDIYRAIQARRNLSRRARQMMGRTAPAFRG